jgi:hypothetical protein
MRPFVKTELFGLKADKDIEQSKDLHEVFMANFSHNAMLRSDIVWLRLRLRFLKNYAHAAPFSSNFKLQNQNRRRGPGS